MAAGLPKLKREDVVVDDAVVAAGLPKFSVVFKAGAAVIADVDANNAGAVCRRFFVY